MSDEMKESKTRRTLVMDDPLPLTNRETKSRRAETARRNAGIERRFAQCGGEEGANRLKDAERLESVADALMKPASAPVVRSGEIAYVSGEAGPASEIVNTLNNPDQSAIDASIVRTELLLAPGTDILALAVDTAASIKADNSPEKMLAHQLAAIHVLTMKSAARALEVEKHQGRYGEGFTVQDSVEYGRLSNTTARLSGAFQGGLLTLQRLRTGASQTVTVRHVTVQSGGQALIGNVKPRGRRSSETPRRGRPK